MTPMRFLKTRIFPPLLARLIRAIGGTLRMRVLGTEHLAEAKRHGGGILYVFWHGRQFYPAYHFAGSDIAIMTSLSVDGEMQSGILGRLGYDLIRGSSSRGAVGGLKGMVDRLGDGRDVALAIDGPKGPAFEAKPGLAFLAGKTGAWIVPLATAFDRYKEFGAWDRFRFPKPWSRGVFLIGRPFRAGDVFHPERLHLLAGRALDALGTEAEALLAEERSR